MGEGQSLLYPLIFWVVFFAIFYFILIRPQREREKKHREFINNLKKGMKVITEGGFLGTIAEVKEKLSSSNLPIMWYSRYLKTRLLRNSQRNNGISHPWSGLSDILLSYRYPARDILSRDI